MALLLGSEPAPGFRRNPAYTIDIEAFPSKVALFVDEVSVAETHGAILLRETSHKPVLYIPQQDVKARLLTTIDRTSYCPYKGNASYYTLTVQGQVFDGAFWSYRSPYQEVAEIAGYFGFYANLLDVKIDGKAVDLTASSWFQDRELDDSGY